MALFTIISVEDVLKTEGQYFVLTNSILSVFVIAGVICLLHKTEKIISKRLFICSSILGVLYAAFLVIGTKIYMGRLSITYQSVIALCAKILMLSPLMICAVAFIIYHIPRFMELLKRIGTGIKLPKEKSVLIYSWIIIFAAWTVVWLAFFPGILNYDAPYQFRQADTGYVNTFHPLIHTYYISSLMWLGKALGNFAIGLFLNSVIQMLFLSFCMAYSCSFMVRIKAPRIVVFIAVLIFALLPINPILALSTTKDIIFSGLFLLLFVKVLEMILYTDMFFEKKCNYFVFILISVLMIAFRRNGIYGYILLIPFLGFIINKYRYRVFCMMIGSIMVFSTVNSAFEKAVGASALPGEETFVIGVPILQVVNAALYEEDKLSAEELQMVNELIASDDREKYNRYILDPIVAAVNIEKIMEEPGKYLKLYSDIGLKAPESYINAFLSINLPYWYPDMIFPHIQAFLETSSKPFQQEDYETIEVKSFIPFITKAYTEMGLNGAHQKIPVLSMLCSPGFSVWILMLYIFICLYYKKYRYIVPCFLLLGLFATIMVAPGGLMRYAYGIMICVPMLIAIVTSSEVFSVEG